MIEVDQITHCIVFLTAKGKVFALKSNGYSLDESFDDPVDVVVCRYSWDILRKDEKGDEFFMNGDGRELSKFDCVGFVTDDSQLGVI